MVETVDQSIPGLEQVTDAGFCPTKLKEPGMHTYQSLGFVLVALALHVGSQMIVVLNE
jgi:hypothetical protein